MKWSGLINRDVRELAEMLISVHRPVLVMDSRRSERELGVTATPLPTAAAETVRVVARTRGSGLTFPPHPGRRASVVHRAGVETAGMEIHGDGSPSPPASCPAHHGPFRESVRRRPVPGRTRRGDPVQPRTACTDPAAIAADRQFSAAVLGGQGCSSARCSTGGTGASYCCGPTRCAASSSSPRPCSAAQRRWRDRAAAAGSPRSA